MSASEEAAFFVETSTGTRYWVNKGNIPGSNFLFNQNMITSLYMGADGKYRTDYNSGNLFGFEVGRTMKTASYPNDLAAIFNSKRCQ